MCSASCLIHLFFFFFSSRRRHTRFKCDWSSDVCSSDLVSGGQFTGNWFNVPTLLLLLALTYILARGVKESAGTNNVMVLIKIAAILIFVIGAARAVNTENWHPFMPNGFSCVLTGAAIVFFTYI